MPAVPDREASRFPLFWLCAGLALALHTILLLNADVLQGGLNLRPHLRLMQQMSEEPGLRTVYAPFYHVAGALLSPVLGLERFPRVFELLAVIAWMAGFRFFQRSARLPEASAALLVLFPYSFTFSWCIPKVEALGYGAVFVGLAFLMRRRHVAVAATLALTFLVHTGSALLLGLSGGILALAGRDVRGLAALAVGTLAASPLFVAHLIAGCSLPELLRMTETEYLIGGTWSSRLFLPQIVALASPVAVAAALLGARDLLRHNRPLAILCGALTLIYLNEIWLAPLGTGIALNLLRGLSVLALPLAVSGGFALRERPRLTPWVLGACAVWAVGSTFLVVPRACTVKPIRLDEIAGIRVERCTFRWYEPKRPQRSRSPLTRPALPR
jgi:hypothetical protein